MSNPSSFSRLYLPSPANQQARNIHESHVVPRTAALLRLGGIALSLAVFFAFIFLDPNSSFLLAACMAANTGIFFWAIYNLYRRQLLLSPMATAVIGPSMIAYYTIGNLGARVAGEGRFGSNPGSLQYYPLAALLSTLGLLLFCVFVFMIIPPPAWIRRISYSHLTWKPWQVLIGVALTTAILVHLSTRYEFVNGYFIDVRGNLDRWLNSSYYFFITLNALSGLSVFVKAKTVAGKIMGSLGLAMPLIFGLATRSRTFVLTLLIFIILAWLTLQPQRAKPILAGGVIFGLAFFSLTTVIKAYAVRGETRSMSQNLASLFDVDLIRTMEINTASAAIDVQYRTAGLEHSAAVLVSLNRGAHPLYGEAMVNGLMSALPGFVRPFQTMSERETIYRNFALKGLMYGDSIGIPLTSGLADWGMLGAPLIYAIMGLFCFGLWQVAQYSPRLFVALTVVWVRVDPMDLFWEDGFFTLRAAAFMWLLLLVLGPLLMPTIERADTNLV